MYFPVSIRYYSRLSFQLAASITSRIIAALSFNPLLLASLIPTWAGSFSQANLEGVSIRYYSRLSFQPRARASLDAGRRFSFNPLLLASLIPTKWARFQTPRHTWSFNPLLLASLIPTTAGLKARKSIDTVSIRYYSRLSFQLVDGVRTSANEDSVSIRYYSRLSFQRSSCAVRLGPVHVSIRYYSRLSFQPSSMIRIPMIASSFNPLLLASLIPTILGCAERATNWQFQSAITRVSHSNQQGDGTAFRRPRFQSAITHVSHSNALTSALPAGRAGQFQSAITRVSHSNRNRWANRGRGEHYGFNPLLLASLIPTGLDPTPSRRFSLSFNPLLLASLIPTVYAAVCQGQGKKFQSAITRVSHSNPDGPLVTEEAEFCFNPLLLASLIPTLERMRLQFEEMKFQSAITRVSHSNIGAAGAWQQATSEFQSAITRVSHSNCSTPTSSTPATTGFNPLLLASLIPTILSWVVGLIFPGFQSAITRVSHSNLKRASTLCEIVFGFQSAITRVSHSNNR